MAYPRRVSDEQVVAAYRETGSVWKAGKLLGIVGQSVHERLRALDYPMRGRNWTNEEQAELERLVDENLPLAEVAHRLGRTYAGVACRASRRSVQSARGSRQRKIPRGAGYDKLSVGRHLKVLEASPLRVTQYARGQGLNVDSLVYAFQKNFPERWQAYLANHSPIPEKICEYCEGKFVPANGKQRYCTRQCGTKANTDSKYFGGRRKETVGLAEGICQLCGRGDVTGLSSHHIFGKENDPGNDHLVALCRGCHQIVTLLGARAFVDSERSWEALISLAWLRRHGHEAFANPNMQVIYTEVTIELSADSDWDDLDEEEEAS